MPEWEWDVKNGGGNICWKDWANVPKGFGHTRSARRIARSAPPPQRVLRAESQTTSSQIMTFKISFKHFSNDSTTLGFLTPL